MGALVYSNIEIKKDTVIESCFWNLKTSRPGSAQRAAAGPAATPGTRTRTAAGD